MNKIKARDLTEEKRILESLEIAYGDLILYCEVRWFTRFRGQGLSRLWKHKNIVHDLLDYRDVSEKSHFEKCKKKMILCGA